MIFTDGVLDDVRIWRVSRSQLDIRESMLLSLSGMETGLEAYWEFNECLGKHAKEKRGRVNTTPNSMEVRGRLPRLSSRVTKKASGVKTRIAEESDSDAE